MIPVRIFFAEITDKYRNEIIEFQTCSALHMVTASLEDQNLCIYVISREDLVGPSTVYSEGLPLQTECKFSNLHL